MKVSYCVNIVLILC